MKRMCPHCGYENKEATKFCRNCGKDFFEPVKVPTVTEKALKNIGLVSIIFITAFSIIIALIGNPSSVLTLITEDISFQEVSGYYETKCYATNKGDKIWAGIVRVTWTVKDFNRDHSHSSSFYPSWKVIKPGERGYSLPKFQRIIVQLKMLSMEFYQLFGYGEIGKKLSWNI